MRKLGAWTLPVLLACAPQWLAAEGEPFAAKKFDWPQWQGPERTAQSRETGLLENWPKGGPKMAWKATGCGAGFVTPSVAAGRVFTMGDLEKVEYAICLKDADGSQLWKTALGPVRSGGGGYPGPRCTPTVDGDVVYCLGLNGDLVCLKVADGKEVWRKDLVKEFGGQPGGWGYCESPLVDGDWLLVTPGGKKASIVALNKKTGERVWTAVVPQGDRAGYSSIVAATIQGEKQYIQFMGRGVVAVASKDGAFLWRFDRAANGTANISTPIVKNDLVFSASAYGTGGALARISKTDAGLKADNVYFTENMQNHHGGMVLIDGYLYGENRGELTCLKFDDGEVQWTAKGAGKGSIAFAEGRLYYRNEGGKIHLIEANPKQYVLIASFSQPDRSKRPAWAHPVIANGRLYIADQDALLCYDVKK